MCQSYPIDHTLRMSTLCMNPVVSPNLIKDHHSLVVVLWNTVFSPPPSPLISYLVNYIFCVSFYRNCLLENAQPSVFKSWLHTCTSIQPQCHRKELSTAEESDNCNIVFCRGGWRELACQIVMFILLKILFKPVVIYTS